MLFTRFPGKNSIRHIWGKISIKPFLSKFSFRQIKQSFSGIKLSSKFILSFLLFILLPFGLFGFINYDQSKKVLEESVSELVMKNNFQISNTLDYYIEDLKAFTRTLSRNSIMLEYFKSVSQLQELELPDADNVQAAIYRMQLRDFVNSNKNIKPEGIYILSSDNVYNILYNHSPISLLDPYNDEWYAETLSNPDEVYVLGITHRFYEGGEHNYVFSLSKVLPETRHTVIHDVLLVDFSLDSIGDLMNIQTYHEFLKGTVYITDRNNKIIYSNDTELIGKELDALIAGKIAYSESAAQKVRLDEKKTYFVIHCTSNNTNWKVISVIPEDRVLHGVFFLKNPVIIVSLLAVAAVLVFFLVVSRMILLKPIKELTTVLSGQYSAKALSGDNIRAAQTPSLSDSFNTISDIKHLVDKVYNIQLKQKEAELNSLQNQINPHFLYNTLESIRGAALYHGLNDIAAMSKALSLFFRYSVSDKFLVPIREEIQYLENYISIQNFRYENKFELIYKIPPEVLNYKILKLTLQPLVENSIKHGLERKVGKGRIRIEILDLVNVLKIIVADDGIGMSHDAVDALNRKLSRSSPPEDSEGQGGTHSSGTGIGVRNINSRIKLYFGEQYGIKYLKPETGTIVEITLPVIKDEDPAK